MNPQPNHTVGDNPGDAQLKSLTDITGPAADALRELQSGLGSRQAGVSEKLLRTKETLQSLERQTAPPPPSITQHKKDSPVTGGTPPAPLNPTGPNVRAAAHERLSHIGHEHPKHAICLELLRQGRIGEFNKERPAGKLDLRGINLVGLDLTGADLRHADLSRAILCSAVLKGAQLQHAILDRADLSDSVLDFAQLFEASLRSADLKKVRSAANAEFHHAKLRGAEMDFGNFSGAIFSDAVLISVSAVGAKFTAATMERVHLGGAILSGASFERAQMHKARLFQANGEDINFAGANLCGAFAFQAYLKSSLKPIGEGQVHKTNFDGAWTHGLQRDGSLTDDLLHGAISDRLPPEGTFSQTPAPQDERVLVDGIPGTDKVLYDAAFEELHELIGLTEVKSYLKRLMSVLKATQSRAQFGLPKLDYTLHRAFTGPPGTGKTTVARIQSKLFFALGCLDKGHLVETDKTGLIAGYQGQTLEKTDSLVNSALGGTLLIDEAYALANSKDDSYAKDAIAVLTKRLEDDRDKFCCIVCGYTNEMRHFIHSNPGLEDRFDDFVEFPSYSSGELIQIMKLHLDKKRYQTDPEFLATASVLFCALKEQKGDNFANGRSVRKAVEKMGMLHASRIDDEGQLQDKGALLTPQIGDLPFRSMLGMERSCLPKLDSLVWIGPHAEKLTVKQLNDIEAFPCLSPESEAAIREAYRANKPSQNPVQ